MVAFLSLDTELLDTKLKLIITQQKEKALLKLDLDRLLAKKKYTQHTQLLSSFYTQQFNQLYFTLLEKQSQIQKAQIDLNRAVLLFNQKVIAETEMEEKKFILISLMLNIKQLLSNTGVNGRMI